MTRADGAQSAMCELIDRLPVPAYALDRAGTVVAWNQALSRLTGVSGAGTVGRSGGAHAVPFIGLPGTMLADLVLDPSLPVPAHLQALVADETSSTARLAAHAIGPGMWLTVVASPLLVDGSRIGAIEVVIDSELIDPRIRASLGIIDRLMRTVRHDILNELTIVLGYVELARDAIADPGANADLDRAVAAANSILRRIEFTREFQEIGARPPVERTLAALVRDAADRVDIDGILLEGAVPDRTVLADPLLLRCLEHLLRLSASSIPPPEVIRIETVGTDPLVLRYGADVSGESVAPRDAGHASPGMDPMLQLMRDVLALDGIQLVFVDDPRWPIEFRIPGSLLGPEKREE